MRFDPKEPGRNMRLHENGSFFQEDGLMASTGSARQIAAPERSLFCAAV